jgi:hypothetical protein
MSSTSLIQKPGNCCNGPGLGRSLAGSPAGGHAVARAEPRLTLRDVRSADEQDAYATARWMADMASRGALAACFDPPLTSAERAVAALEGWVLGVR